CRQVLPVMRKQGNGQIINIGSVAEFIPIPFQAMYSASKYALESFTQALRIEVEPFNIRVSIVAPGDTKTNFTAARTYSAQSVTNPAYREQLKRALYAMASYEMKGKDPHTVAKVVRRIIDRKKPPIRVVVCMEYKLVALGKRLLPAKWVDAAYKKIYIGAKIPKNPIWDFEKEVLGEKR
ncbi:MAG: SDR family NAD(P)-dependent oxidoreductase, partial [Christensenellales bacterium]